MDLHEDLLYELDDLCLGERNDNEGSRQGAASREHEHDGPNDMTCAVCLEQIELENLALVKGCEHMYCLNCILLWSISRDPAFCPTCKGPFDYLVCYRQLDGTLSDYPSEESVVLLKRARWFEEYVAAREGRSKQSAETAPPAAARAPESDFWLDYDDYEHDDDEIEDYYFSSAAGRARVVLGNRRMGENGFMRSGRRYARPVLNTPNQQPAKSTAAAGTGASASASKGAASSSKSSGSSSRGASSSHAASCRSGGSGARCGQAIMAASPVMGSSPPFGSSPPLGCSPGSAGRPGRRAKRNARRAAADGDFELDY